MAGETFRQRIGARVRETVGKMARSGAFKSRVAEDSYVRGAVKSYIKRHGASKYRPKADEGNPAWRRAMKRQAAELL